jgi:hypothetical protein
MSKARPLFSVGGLVSLAIVGALVYALIPGAKETIDTVASHSGVVGKVVPWADRAETALRQMMDGSFGASMARTIRGITHPTGSDARLRSYDVRRMGDRISVRISTDWQGLSDASYTTDVVWEFDEAHHIVAEVVSDNALFSVAAENARQLDEYFRREFYPVLWTNTGR